MIIVLLLGAKRYNYKSDDGQSQKGVKFFAIDPLSYDESDDYFGFQLLEASLSGSTLEPFSQVPAYYYVEMEQTRGRNGDAVYKPTLVEFKTNFTLSAAPPPPSN